MAKAVRARSRTRATKSRAAEAAATNTPGTKRGASKPTMTKKRSKRSAATRVMGVTIPKTLTNVLDSLVNSPRGREILASALVAAATAAAAALVKSSGSAQVAKVREAVAISEVGDQVAAVTKDLSEVAAGALADIVTDAARSVLPSSLTGTSGKKRSGV